ncbi:hypothetical protein ACFVOR_16255 [Streptomyces sp. NPDC057837]|uniref:hypothetical protein n=1 Tax=Streptomyces sp. NPDC057837 TaxID=3346260 RepID=UPI00368E6202
MEQATQATTPTDTHAQLTDRASYDRARELADQLATLAKVLPDSTETRRELGTDAYGIRLHFGTGLAAGRGVLATADVTDTGVIRDDIKGDGYLSGVWIEVRTTYKGVPLIARALTTAEEADTLLQRNAASEETQPIPTVGTSPSDVVAPTAPAVFAVTPLAAMNTGPGAGK